MLALKRFNFMLIATVSFSIFILPTLGGAESKSGNSYSRFSFDSSGILTAVRVSLHSHRGNEFLQISHGVPADEGGLYTMNVIYFVDCIKSVKIETDANKKHSIMTITQSRLFICAAHFDSEQNEYEVESSLTYTINMGADQPPVDEMANIIEKMIKKEVYLDKY